MSNNKNRNPLLRDGTSQMQRLLPDLDPESIKIDAKTREDYVEFTQQMAEYVQFYNIRNGEDGDWSLFFKNYEQEKAKQVHLALYDATLTILDIAKSYLNTIPHRHLNFYYRDILRFQEKEARPDKVHVLFDLTSDSEQATVPKGALLNAGKSEEGQVDLFYQTDRELIVNRAKIDQIHTLFINKRYNSYEDKTYIDKLLIEPDLERLDYNELSGEGDDNIEGWYLFGDKTVEKEAEIGFAISSSLLFMSEGVRKVKLKAYFGYVVEGEELSSLEFIKDLNVEGWVFKALLTTEEGWLEKEVTIVTKSNAEASLLLEFELDINDPPIVAYKETTHQQDMACIWPLLKIYLVNRTNMIMYEQLYKEPLLKVDLDIEVSEMTNLSLQSDGGLLDNSNPFGLFGPQPIKESNFYIGVSEILNKSPETAKIDIVWHNIPSDYETYYQEYPSLKGKPFEVVVAWLQDKKWNYLSNESMEVIVHPLFNDHKFTSIELKDIRFPVDDILQKPESDSENIYTEDRLYLDKNTRRGFMKIELYNPPNGFGHKQYPNLYADRMFKKTHDPDVLLPREPYIPTVRSISLSYSAKISLSLAKDMERDYQKIYENRNDYFYHLHPFGVCEVHPHLPPVIAHNLDEEDENLSKHVGCRLIPTYEKEGNIFIGLTEITPGQNLSMLFQLLEGSANPELTKPDIHWRFLASNVWHKIGKTDILMDTTNSLLNSGIKEMKISEAINNENTILEKGLYWLWGYVEKNSKGINKGIDINTQVVRATFVQNDEAKDHLKRPLQPGSIKDLEDTITEVDAIHQPFSSFDGKTKEEGLEFYNRVSERLRHKGRGVSVWDYERMVLEKFNNIYKVKCLNHTSTDAELAPGHVTLITIPLLRNKNAVNPLKPKTPLSTLKEIKLYMIDYISPFLNLEVENPVYEELRVDFDVGFKKGYDGGQYVNQLHEELKRFLSPWAFEEGEDIVFGGRIHMSSIIDYIEKREYVHFVNNVRLFHEGVMVKEAIATSSKSILVSAKVHNINPIPYSEESYLIPEGIDHMYIQVNFVVN